MYICYNCISDDYLALEVKQKGNHRKCAQCNGFVESILFKELCDEIEGVFSTFFELTSNEPPSYMSALYADKELDYEFEREGTLINYLISDLIGLSDQIVENIREELFDRQTVGMRQKEIWAADELDFSEESHYEEKYIDTEDDLEEWLGFEHNVKKVARYYSPGSHDLLTENFNDIRKYEAYFTKEYIKKIPPGKANIYRARVFQNEKDLKKALSTPEKNLGSPPSYLASAGRMNSKGISVFYGATNRYIALSEVRPPAGSKVVSAKFKNIRPLKLLDMGALMELDPKGSYFNPLYYEAKRIENFMRVIVNRLTNHVLPENEEDDYIPTQILADFLAWEPSLRFDGIMFPSSQSKSKGKNVVLFHLHARVKSIERNNVENTEVELTSWDNEGSYADYFVIDWVPSKLNDKPSETVNHNSIDNVFDPDYNWREDELRLETLAIDESSIRVHHIDAIKYQTTPHNIKRVSWEKTDSSDMLF